MITMNIGCDLDGTLIDTRLAVKKAYEHVGVKHWKSDAPWHAFATEEQHSQKGYIYPMFLKQYAHVLPLAEVAIQSQWEILTGASVDALLSIREVFPLFRHLDTRWVHCNLVTSQDKVRVIKQHGISLYIDDNPQTLAVIKSEVPACQVLLHTEL